MYRRKNKLMLNEQNNINYVVNKDIFKKNDYLSKSCIDYSNIKGIRSKDQLLNDYYSDILSSNVIIPSTTISTLCHANNEIVVNREKSGSIKEESGTIKEESGTIKEESGTIKEESGIIKEESTTIRDENDTYREESTTNREESDTYREESTTIKEENDTNIAKVCKILENTKLDSYNKIPEKIEIYYKNELDINNEEHKIESNNDDITDDHYNFCEEFAQIDHISSNLCHNKSSESSIESNIEPKLSPPLYNNHHFDLLSQQLHHDSTIIDDINTHDTFKNDINYTTNNSTTTTHDTNKIQINTHDNYKIDNNSDSIKTIQSDINTSKERVEKCHMTSFTNINNCNNIDKDYMKYTNKTQQIPQNPYISGNDCQNRIPSSDDVFQFPPTSINNSQQYDLNDPYLYNYPNNHQFMQQTSYQYTNSNAYFQPSHNNIPPPHFPTQYFILPQIPHYYSPYNNNDYITNTAYIRWQQDYTRWYQMYSQTSSRTLSRQDSINTNHDNHAIFDHNEHSYQYNQTTTKDLYDFNEYSNENPIRTTPLCFNSKHSLSKFGVDNSIYLLDGNHVNTFNLSIDNIEDYDFPYPLDGTANTNHFLLKYMSNTIKNWREMDQITKLTWQLLYNLTKNNAKLNILGMCDKLMEFNHLKDNINNSESTIRNKITNLILNNNISESINTAISINDWGLAFALSTSVNDNVLQKYIDSLSKQDLIRTYLCIKSSIPIEVSNMNIIEFCSNWNQHLAIILSKCHINRDKCINEIEWISNILKSKSRYSEYFFCRLLLDLVFDVTSSEHVLFSEISETFSFVNKEDIIKLRTIELYENIKRVKCPNFMMKKFEMLKFKYAQFLCIQRQFTRSLLYCECICKNSVINHQLLDYSHAFLNQLYNLCLKLYRIHNFNSNLPQWLVNVQIQLENYGKEECDLEKLFAEKLQISSSLDLSAKINQISPIFENKNQFVYNNQFIPSLPTIQESPNEKTCYTTPTTSKQHSDNTSSNLNNNNNEDDISPIPLIPVSVMNNTQSKPFVPLREADQVRPVIPLREVDQPKQVIPVCEVNQPKPFILSHQIEQPKPIIHHTPVHSNSVQINPTSKEIAQPISRVNSETSETTQPVSRNIISNATKLISTLFKSKDEVFLPDDSKPSIVYDPVSKRYIDTSMQNQPNSNSSTTAPPKIIQSISSNSSNQPQPAIYRRDTVRYVTPKY